MKEYKKIGNVILDIKTGLEWKLGRDRNTTWKEANEWIKKINKKNNKEKWRIPTVEEVKELHEVAAGSCSINPMFSKKRFLWVWIINEGTTLRCFFFFRFNQPIDVATKEDYDRVLAVREGRQI